MEQNRIKNNPIQSEARHRSSPVFLSVILRTVLTRTRAHTLDIWGTENFTRLQPESALLCCFSIDSESAELADMPPPHKASTINIEMSKSEHVLPELNVKDTSR